MDRLVELFIRLLELFHQKPASLPGADVSGPVNRTDFEGGKIRVEVGVGF